MRELSVARTLVTSLAVAVLACALASAQYQTGFEPPTFTGSAAGTILTGQDAFYIPAGTVSTDQLVFTYAGNALGIPAHPTGGGTQFVAAESPGGGTYPRGQRDITWTSTGQWLVSYDVCAAYDGDPNQTVNNIGSFSVQPYVTPSTAEAYIHLASWTAPGTGDLTWQAGYIASNAAGGEDPQPGRFPGPEWQGLSLYTWYRFTTLIDFDANLIIEASITNLSTGASTTVDLSDQGYYLSGSDGGTQPTGFRFFCGGAQAVGLPGNIIAWDNLYIGPPPSPCPGDLDGDGDTDLSDLSLLLAAYGIGPGGDLDGDGDTDLSDLALLLADYGCTP